MRYLKDADYLTTINTDILLSVLEANSLDNNTTLRNAESQAQAIVRQTIGKRYDMDTFFTVIEDIDHNDVRDQAIVYHLLTIVVYLLYKKQAPHKIPEHRKLDYDDTIEWLRDAGRGEIDVYLPLIGETDDIGEIKINSYPKDNHRY